MATESFYWFDYETWGISPQWDRPAQFAGVRTDANLNQVGDATMLYCQPPPDYLPDPGACRVTGLSPLEVQRRGIPEPDFMRAVLSELGRSDTCSVGYNSIRFDDEVTRHSLFRNFHDPYRQEWHDGNSRWDLLDVVRLTRALRPDGIEWPCNDDGKPNNRLENLSACNGLAHEHAHDALSDVYATIAVARLIRKQQPKLYDYSLTMRNKSVVSAMLNWREAKPLVHITGMVPADRMHTSIVVPLMPNPSNKNAVVVLDMRTDPEQLVGLSSEEIRQRLYTSGLNADQRVHIRNVHVNRCPMLAPITTLSEADAARIGIIREVELERATRVAQTLDSDTRAAILGALSYQASDQSKRMDADIARCPEASLYTGGFLGDSDRRRANALCQLPPESLHNFTEQNGFFDDERLQRLLMSYRARYALDSCSKDERLNWAADCAERLLDDDEVSWRTFSAFDATMAATEWPAEEQMLKDALLAWRKRVFAYVNEPTK